MKHVDRRGTLSHIACLALFTIAKMQKQLEYPSSDEEFFFFKWLCILWNINQLKGNRETVI